MLPLLLPSLDPKVQLISDEQSAYGYFSTVLNHPQLNLNCLATVPARYSFAFISFLILPTLSIESFVKRVFLVLLFSLLFMMFLSALSVCLSACLSLNHLSLFSFNRFHLIYFTPSYIPSVLFWSVRCFFFMVVIPFLISFISFPLLFPFSFPTVLSSSALSFFLS